MNFGSLKSRILALIGRAPNDVVYELVTADINAGLRLRDMEEEVTITEAAEITLPADFLSIVSVYRDTSPRTTIQPSTPQALQRGFMPSGPPTHYALVDGKMILSPAPDGTSDVVIRYVAKLADLSADADTNAILTKFPSIYVYGALAHHAALIRDAAAAAMYEAQYQKAARAAKATDRDRYSGAPLVPTVMVTP